MSNGTNRPTAVLVLGIISIVLGALGICGGIFNLMSNMIPMGAGKGLDIPADVRSWLTVLQAIGLVMNVVLIISGIGLLKTQNWARILSMIYAVLDIPVTIVGSYVSTKVVLPLLEKSTPQGVPPEALKLGMMFGLGAGVCCGLIYPIVLLVILNLKSIRGSFTGTPSAPPQIEQQ